MKREYDAVVVGGGIAGLTSAAYLCRQGASTLVVEKNKKTGGLVNTFWREGFAFDGGIRSFENSGILLPMLKNLGIDMEFVKSTVSIGIAGRWTRLTSSASLEDYVAMLGEFFPDHTASIEDIANEIHKVMEYMDVLYGIDNPLFLDDLRNAEYLKNTLLPWFLKYLKNIRKVGRLNEPVYPYLKSLTTEDRLVDMIAQHFFADTPTFFALSYFSLYLDYLYPPGGTGTLALKMTEYIQNAGGEILTETSASQVDVDKNEVLLSHGETVRYKKLVWAADQKTLYSIMGETNSTKVQKRRSLVEKGSGSDSVLTVFLAIDLDQDYFSDRCGPHAFYTPVIDGLSSLPGWRGVRDDFTPSMEWVEGFLDKTTYEISCPVLRDSSLAPEGQTGLIVSTLFDYDVARHFFDAGDYEAFKAFCQDKVIDILERSLFPGLRSKLLFSICATPLTMERESGNSQGAITGWAFTEAKMPSENRFTKISRSIKTPLKDVVQCGQWTFSPAGLPVGILTGKLAADAVLKQLTGS